MTAQYRQSIEARPRDLRFLEVLNQRGAVAKIQKVKRRRREEAKQQELRISIKRKNVVCFHSFICIHSSKHSQAVVLGLYEYNWGKTEN